MIHSVPCIGHCSPSQFVSVSGCVHWYFPNDPNLSHARTAPRFSWWSIQKEHRNKKPKVSNNHSAPLPTNAHTSSGLLWLSKQLARESRRQETILAWTDDNRPPMTTKKVVDINVCFCPIDQHWYNSWECCVATSASCVLIVLVENRFSTRSWQLTTEREERISSHFFSLSQLEPFLFATRSDTGTRASVHMTFPQIFPPPTFLLEFRCYDRHNRGGAGWGQWLERLG